MEPGRVSGLVATCPDQARSDGWILSCGRWQHDDRAECYDDGDWIYLGDGVWEDAYLASPLPADTRRDLMDKYTAVLAETADVVRREYRDAQRHGDGDH